jgi:hypothetical protein
MAHPIPHSHPLGFGAFHYFYFWLRLFVFLLQRVDFCNASKQIASIGECGAKESILPSLNLFWVL